MACACLGKKMRGGVTVRSAACGTTARNTTTTAKKGEAKNETEQCKNRDSPISPSDPQASTTISGGCPLFENE
ncbi:MAG: hypothetical protein PHU62_01620 [Bacteroidales bacterium]|nr:hypothetical protein [Bacteroidales bacterium]MDD2203827.1 hypothetical protein [Bacteroidales bacterium]MDD4633265.1 hypothetical protein [Bacteroidales bacterium]